jgi:MoaA/NifB/PqqE/SkfB family radical SAM enzyme
MKFSQNSTVPQHLRLEASSNCQLKCPSCPTAAGVVQQALGGGFLSFESFKKIVDENPHLLHIELSNWGEIFLNPQIIQIMEYAYKRGVILTASNGANLNTMKEEVLESLAKYRFRRITCSIDGASQETYRIYRKGGNFDQVIDNIKKINHYKQKYNTQFPLLYWQFVVFGHNEHEITKAEEMANSLGMEHFFVKLSWDRDFSPIRNKDTVDQASGSDINAQEDFWEKVVCTQLWNIPQVNWDGRVLGCCVNTWKDFGNAFEGGLTKVLIGEKMNYARQMLLGEKEAREDIPCTSCGHYKSMKNSQNWITNEDINKFRYPYPVPKLLGRLRIWLSNRFRSYRKRGRNLRAGITDVSI